MKLIKRFSLTVTGKDWTEADQIFDDIEQCLLTLESFPRKFTVSYRIDFVAEISLNSVSLKFLCRYWVRSFTQHEFSN